MENIDEPTGEGEDISESEGEEETTAGPFLTLFPRNSFLRQVFCLSSVIALPYFRAITASLGRSVSGDSPDELYKPVGTETIGGVVGFIFGGIVWYLIGSKSLVIIANLLNLVLLALAVFLLDITTQEHTLYAIGLKNSFSHLAFFVYTAEISDNSFRAFFMGLYVLIEYAIRPNFNTLWRVDDLASIYQISLGITIFSLLLSLIVPETPFSAARKGQSEKATAIYEWVRADEVDEFEYEMMLEKASGIEQYKDIASKILSLTFAICMITGFITNIILIDNDDCDLLTIVTQDYYFRGVEKNRSLRKDHRSYFMTPKDIINYSVMFGCMIYQWICFYVPRKRLYTVTIVLNLLPVVPVILHEELEMIKMIRPLCYMIPVVGINQTRNLLPIEIFPAALRYVGVPLSYITNIVARYIRIRDGVKIVFVPKYLYRNWTYFNLAVTLIGLPFLLVFVPETINRNLYELEDIRKPLTDQSMLSEENEEEENAA